MAIAFRSEQPHIASQTFKVVLDAPPNLIKMYDWMECCFVDYKYLIGEIPLGIINPRDELFEQRGYPVEELEEVQFEPNELGKSFQIEKLLSDPL